MRSLVWSATALLIVHSIALAQQPPARPAAPPALQPQAQRGQPQQAPPAAVPPLNQSDPKLDALLVQWEQTMRRIQAIDASVIRTETDGVTGTKEEFEGRARLLRPDRADLYLVKKGKPDVFERFVVTGVSLYEFKPKEKIVRVHALPQRGPGQAAFDDNFLGLLFGMSAQEAKRRYDMKLVKSDQYYHYLIVKPLLPGDKAEFTEARLVLWVQSMLPREISFVQPNGSPIKWDIARIDPNARLGPTDFQKPKLDGWQVINVPPPAAPLMTPLPNNGPAPTKVRPSGGN